MIAFGYPNLITAETVFSGGDWALPLSNLKSRDLSLPARSVDAQAASTQIRMDHGSARPARALAFCAHNLSAAATIEWDRGTTSGANDVHDGAPVNAWQIPRNDYSHVIVVLPQSSSAQHDTIKISDTANSAGYVEIGRPWIGPLWSPSYNVAYGLQDSVLDLSATERSDAGALWTWRRRRLRSVSGVLQWLSLAEAAVVHDLQMAAGTTEEVLYLPEVSRPADCQRYGYIATLEELSPLDYPYYRTRAWPFRATEIA